LVANALEQAKHPAEAPKLGFGHKAATIKPNLEIAESKSIIGMFPNDPNFDTTMDAVRFNQSV
jgi:hypothetical protein